MSTAENVHYLPSRAPDRSESKRGIQVEDGFTRTANALVEAFCRAPLTSREARIVRVIERMTYGWNKAEDWIAASVFSEMTGMSEGKCSETLNGLIRKNVVTRKGGGRSPVRINKNVEEWNFDAQKARVTPKQAEKPEWGDSPQNGVSELPQDGVTNPPQNGVTPKDIKDTKDKEIPNGISTSEKSNTPKHRFEEIDMQLAELMASHVDAITETTGKHNLPSWANTIRLMRERDELSAEQIRWLMNWVHHDDFWQTNVLSPAKLRQKKTQLIAKAKQQHKPKRVDGRKGFAQPKPVGSYGPGDDDLPDWAKGVDQ